MQWNIANHKKEFIFVNSSEVDEPGPCYTEWSKSERENKISYIRTYLRYLEKWYWWS